MSTMIYDAFLFFNELELLELRLHELDEVVDRFVIVEATTTFTNRPKPLHFADNRERFAAFAHKIIHVVVEDSPHTPNAWAIEDFQRGCIGRGFARCASDDLVMVSDVDEIPRPEKVRQAAAALPFRNGPLAAAWHALLRRRPVARLLRRLYKKKGHPYLRMFEQTVYAYYINCRSDQSAWYGTRMMRYRDYIDAIETRRWKGAIVADGGWHFTYMGGVDRIREKLNSFSHQEFNTPAITDPQRLEALVGGGQDILGLGLTYRFVPVDESFPRYLRKHPEKFAHWLGAKPEGASA